ncbi:hypothetical protein I203_102185 [Kwoniella mangroviensis CBS 8507]|uniref:uncharacterized protein n=1 Tax=Kwoniella mangroviensis CBS 8507 TaxID=1296122 RepID=UPI00303B8742
MRFKVFSRSRSNSTSDADTAPHTDTDIGATARTETRTAGEYSKSSRSVLRVRGGCCSTRGVTVIPPIIYSTPFVLLVLMFDFLGIRRWGNQGG